MSAKSLGYYRERYVRSQPSAFCVGCGNGTILNCFVRAIDDLGIPKERVLCVSGIGCSAWIPSPNFNGDTLHTTHGRALAFATGAKAYNSDLVTVVFTGDGDGAGIGGNHLIHAARRNIDITTILVNNMSYAMTGGQIAPTTHHGEVTATSPYGNPETPFDITRLVAAAGATYVARWSVNNVVELTRSIKDGIQNRGFSFIEVLSQCPTQQRRMFNIRDSVHRLPVRMLKMLEESTYVRDRRIPGKVHYAVPRDTPEATLKDIQARLPSVEAEAVDRMDLGRVIKVTSKPDADLASLSSLGSVGRLLGSTEGKIELGVFVREERPEFTESLREVLRRAGGG